MTTKLVWREARDLLLVTNVSAELSQAEALSSRGRVSDQAPNGGGSRLVEKCMKGSLWTESSGFLELKFSPPFPSVISSRDGATLRRSIFSPKMLIDHRGQARCETLARSTCWAQSSLSASAVTGSRRAADFCDKAVSKVFDKYLTILYTCIH